MAQQLREALRTSLFRGYAFAPLHQEFSLPTLSIQALHTAQPSSVSACESIPPAPCLYARASLRDSTRRHCCTPLSARLCPCVLLLFAGARAGNFCLPLR